MDVPWELSPDDIVALSLDELALRVLAHFRASAGWNWRNWLLERQQQLGTRTDAGLALAEAWGWIVSHGLVAVNISQSSAEAVVVSRHGTEVLRRGMPWLRAVERLDLQLMDVLEAKARPQFVRGDFEAAAFMAMKEVEVAVRKLSGLEDGLVGTKLMQEAFRPSRSAEDSGGPLYAPESEPGEAVAVMDLFKGAIGSFKNPSSHRRVDIGDPTEAAEVVLLADLLLRLLAKIENR